jgi:hypothetical protein
MKRESVDSFRITDSGQKPGIAPLVTAIHTGLGAIILALDGGGLGTAAARKERDAPLRT